MIVLALRPAAVSLLAFSLCAPNTTPGPAQAPVERPQAPAAEPAAGPVLTCEVFCSDTKLRTANARLRWQAPAAGPDAAAAATGKAQIQATVFARGFEKGIYVTLPVGGALPAPAVAAQPKAQARPLRAFEIRLIESTPLQRSAAGPAEAGVVVENLEPGMNYTFRLLVDSAAGRSTSQEVTCQAPICPADMADEKVPPSPPRRTP